jgi:hypothetical protein
LRKTFPKTFAASLMPDHIHLLVEPEEKTIPMQGLAAKLRSCLPPADWEPITEPQPVANTKHLRRLARYIHLNPCRDQLARDPLSWEWSTHLDYMNLVAFPWQGIEQGRKHLGFTTAANFHRYVSADPTVKVEGSAPPQDVLPKDLHILSLKLGSAEGAASVVFRCDTSAFRRKGALRARFLRCLTAELGLNCVAVAREYGLHHSSVIRRPRRSPHHSPAVDQSIATALLQVMADPRLRQLWAKGKG